jgi:16S rRNA (cytidine1402-2'-O)-methyltransferase
MDLMPDKKSDTGSLNAGNPPDENLETSSAAISPGTLYIVGTPIGNLGDLSPRAAAILAGVDTVAAEDTRHTLRLLNHLGLRKHLESYHEHNWQTKGPLLLARLQQGHSLALVSDAGMPCISDPGSEMVRLCVAHDLPVVVIPGPCAAIVGLAGSGLLTDRFVFEGFLPNSGKERQERLNTLSGEARTIILYEAPHRLKRTLADLHTAGLAIRRLTLCRELTKRYEEFLRLTVAEAIDWYSLHEPRGEFVLILEGFGAFSQRCPEAIPAGEPGVSADSPEVRAAVMLRSLLDDGLSIKDAVKRCSLATGLKKNDLYQMALDLRQDNEPDEQPE